MQATRPAAGHPATRDLGLLGSSRRMKACASTSKCRFALVASPQAGPLLPGSRHHLDLGALRLVLRELERLDGVAQRKLAADQGPDVDATRRQIVDRPVELDPPAKG